MQSGIIKLSESAMKLMSRMLLDPLETALHTSSELMMPFTMLLLINIITNSQIGHCILTVCTPWRKTCDYGTEDSQNI